MGNLVELTREECRSLLENEVVGRIALRTQHGIEIVPTNYQLLHESIIIRTLRDGMLGRFAPLADVAFQVDYFDNDYHRGWSVLATGPCEVVADVDQLRNDPDYWDPRPWASGERHLYLRVNFIRLTGRRLQGGWDMLSYD